MNTVSSVVDKQEAYHPLSRRCIIFLKQDSPSDDIDTAILSVRLSVWDTPELYQNG